MPNWLPKEHEGTWEKAKAAALKTYKESDDGFWAVVTSIYKKMGGTIKSDEIDQISETIMAKENLPMNEEPKEIILCKDSGVVLASAKKWEFDQPTTFQWMPGGVTTINAHFNGKPIELTVQADATTARAVQSSYEDWFKVRPKQTPFGCVEHREEEAAIRLPKGVAAFEWHDGTVEGEDAGIYCTALPTELGVKNVNGRIHSSWSPSFTTDAEYAKAKDVNNRMVFPSGVRGSRENPASITGVAFSVGSLTNKPAFRNISPVRAKQADPEDTDKVDATWSDAAREAAIKARNMHGESAFHHRKIMFAHEQSQMAHQSTIAAIAEGTASHHHEAAMYHERAAQHHRDLGEGYLVHAKMHDKLADAHREDHRKLFNKKANDRPEMHDKYSKANTRASESEVDELYARLATDNEEVNEIYAKLAEPEDPMASFYDQLNGGVVRAEESVVEATGTSQGVKKSWQHRKGGIIEHKGGYYNVSLIHSDARTSGTQIYQDQKGGSHGPAAAYVLEKKGIGEKGREQYGDMPVAHAFIHHAGQTHHYDLSKQEHVHDLEQMSRSHEK